MDDHRRSITEWDETDVQNWLVNLGYPQYESQIMEHRISGEILCMLDQEALKNVGVTTIGQRLAILKAVYQTKLAHNIPLDPDGYVPPSEAYDRENITIEKLHVTVKDQSQRLRALEEENRHLNGVIQSFVEEFNHLRSSLGLTEESPIRRQPSFKWAQYKPSKSPTKAEIDSPHPSPQQLEHDVPAYTRAQGQSQFPSSSSQPEKPRPPPLASESPSIAPAPKPLRQDSADNLKSFKVSLEDPTWKVLPAALKKYRINNDNWENYAMFICYGSPGNRIERCLSYDEKPLLLFQKLKDAKKNPVFMLKHIKDIRSPIVVAQQKHAARKANSIISADSTTTSATTGHVKSPSARIITRPPKLEVQDISAATPSIMTALSPQPGWPDSSIASPAVDQQRLDDLSLAPTSAGTSQPHTLGQTLSPGPHDGIKSPDSAMGSAREMPLPSAGVSYAVAIYPYMAEQEDEFDVVVGDTFVILSRARGWWVVQRDPTGSGLVDTDIVKQGWVPAGCLLETSVPVASAIAEANAAKTANGSSPPHSPNSKTPILPLSIISTSFPGIALMDYKKKGDEELDLVKDDPLRVFKRYNHWSYAVKEDGGDRGWVPSWFIGKVATAGVPPTPNTSVPPSTLDDASQAQVSPMSSAFPSVGRS